MDLNNENCTFCNWRVDGFCTNVENNFDIGLGDDLIYISEQGDFYSAIDESDELEKFIGEIMEKISPFMTKKSLKENGEELREDLQDMVKFFCMEEIQAIVLNDLLKSQKTIMQENKNNKAKVKKPYEFCCNKYW